MNSSTDRFTIGVDFGTLSGRAVIVRVRDGAELGSATFDYPNAVIDQTLPSSGAKLPPEWALQDPQDYLEVFKHTIPEALRNSNVDARDVIGIGIDFTACTVLPVKRDGTPLSSLAEFKNNPHAYVKLWKHHVRRGYRVTVAKSPVNGCSPKPCKCSRKPPRSTVPPTVCSKRQTG
jgi:L-ribulokinase